MITEYTLYELIIYHIVFKLAFHWQKKKYYNRCNSKQVSTVPETVQNGDFFEPDIQCMFYLSRFG